MTEQALMPTISPETEIRTHDNAQWVYYNGVCIVQLGRKKALDDRYCHPEPGYDVGRCKMIKRDGNRCKNPVRHGWTVCHFHGAGRPGKPGGLNNRQVTTARHTSALPTRLLAKYEEAINDPDYLSMTEELALLDTRMAEMLERLDTTDVKLAWQKVRRAYQLLDNDNIEDDGYNNALELLQEALTMKSADDTIWKEVAGIIEQRRKVAETERRRVVDAQSSMTYERANMLVAFLMSSVQSHVTDPEILRAIADDLKRVNL